MTLNNFDEFSMLSAGSLATYVGFTEEEVQKLAEEYHQNFCHLIKRNRDCVTVQRLAGHEKTNGIN